MKKKTSSNTSLPQQHSPFTAHLEELRKRIIYCCIAAAAASIIAYHYKEDILLFLIKPLGKVYFLTPAEAFISYLKISVIVGAFLASPFIAYHALAFTWSAFRPIEKKYIITYGILAIALFLAGVIFGCAVCLPAAINFLLSFGKDYLLPIMSVSRYLNFCLLFICVFGLLFEMPLLIIFITDTGLLKIEDILSRRRHVILSIFIVAAVITPGPDVFTQFLAAALLYVLFEAGMLAARGIILFKRR